MSYSSSLRAKLVGRGTIQRRLDGGGASARDAWIDAECRAPAAHHESAGSPIVVQIHDFTVERDAAREEYIRGLGLQILRIPARDVMADAHSVADGLVRLCGPSTTQLR